MRTTTLLLCILALPACETTQELFAPKNKAVVTETVQVVDGVPVVTRTTAAPIDPADAAFARGTDNLFAKP